MRDSPTTPGPAHLTIGVWLSRSAGLGRAMLAGIRRHAGSRRGEREWHLRFFNTRRPLEAVVGEGPLDGVIAHIGRPEQLAELRRATRHVVCVSNLNLALRVPRVVSDDEAVGQLGARRLLDRQFAHFAFAGHAGHGYSELRERGFQAALREAGQAAVCLAGPAEEMAAAARALPRPLALMAANDRLGRLIVEALGRAGVRIPEEIAVLGVDNEELDCELSPVPLSSIALSGARIGLEAGLLLDRLMAGETPPKKPVLVPPGSIVIRRSTDVYAAEDPMVARALRLMRERTAELFTTQEVAVALKVPRRTLDRRCRKALGRTTYEELTRCHVDRARHLLAETDMPLADVAVESGFSDQQMLSVVFKKATGSTPGAWRRERRG